MKQPELLLLILFAFYCCIVPVQTTTKKITKYNNLFIFEYVFELLNAKVICRHKHCQVTVNYFSHNRLSKCPAEQKNCITHTEKLITLKIEEYFDKIVKHILVSDSIKYVNVGLLAGDLKKIFSAIDPSFALYIGSADSLARKQKLLSSNEIVTAIFDIYTEKEILHLLNENKSLLAVNFEPFNVALDWTDFINSIKHNTSVRLLKFDELLFGLQNMNVANEKVGSFSECSMPQLLEVFVKSGFLPLPIIQKMLGSLNSGDFSLQILNFSSKIAYLDLESLFSSAVQFAEFLIHDMIPNFKGSSLTIDLSVSNVEQQRFHSKFKINDKLFGRYFTEMFMKSFSQKEFSFLLDVSFLGCVVTKRKFKCGAIKPSKAIKISYPEMNLKEKQEMALLAKELGFRITIKDEPWYFEKDAKSLSLRKHSSEFINFYIENLGFEIVDDVPDFKEIVFRPYDDLHPCDLDFASVLKRWPNIKKLTFPSFQDPNTLKTLKSISEIQDKSFKLDKLVFEKLDMENVFLQSGKYCEASQDIFKLIENLGIEKIHISNVYQSDKNTLLQIFEIILSFVKIPSMTCLEFNTVEAKSYVDEKGDKISPLFLKQLLFEVISTVRSKKEGIVVSVSFLLTLLSYSSRILRFNLVGDSLELYCGLINPSDIEELKAFASNKFIFNGK